MHERRQQYSAADNGDLQLLRGAQLRVVRTDRRGINHEHRAGSGDLLSPMANVNIGAAPTELAHFLIENQIRTCNAMAQIEEQVAQPTHTTTPCSDEINQRAGTRFAEALADLI